MSTLLLTTSSGTWLVTMEKCQCKLLQLRCRCQEAVNWKKGRVIEIAGLKCPQKYGYSAKSATGCHFSAIFLWQPLSLLFPLLICPLSIWQTWLPFPSICCFQFVCRLSFGENVFPTKGHNSFGVWNGSVVNRSHHSADSLILPAKEFPQMRPFILTYLGPLFLVSKMFILGT